MNATRYEPSGSTYCAEPGPPIRPVSGSGTQDGPDTGAAILVGRRCQLTRQAAGQLRAAGFGAAEAASLVPPPPQPATRRASAASSAGSATADVRLDTSAGG